MIGPELKKSYDVATPPRPSRNKKNKCTLMSPEALSTMQITKPK